jgi:hypothetical protein
MALLFVQLQAIQGVRGRRWWAHQVEFLLVMQLRMMEMERAKGSQWWAKWEP